MNSYTEKLPCKNCLILPRCKALMKSKTYISSVDNSENFFITNLKCNLLTEYCYDIENENWIPSTQEQFKRLMNFNGKLWVFIYKDKREKK